MTRTKNPMTHRIRFRAEATDSVIQVTKLLGAALLMLLWAAPTLADDGKGRLVIEIVGFGSNSGSVKVALWNAAESFLVSDDYVARGEGPIAELAARVVLEDIPHGEYAVSVFHDENDNGKLDTGFMRIPKEPIGTSNNARGRFGPPKYRDARFDFETAELRLTIDLQQL